MILYQNNAGEFKNDVDSNDIVRELETAYVTHMGHRESDAERHSWNNSLRFMETIIRKAGIPDDCGILLEYNIPSTSKRIDFIVSGHDEQGEKNFVIIELKQWESARATDMDRLVNTYVGGANRDVTHPSYQAHTYKQFMLDLNEAVADGELHPSSCAYLHNYIEKQPEPLLSEQYLEAVTDSPLFFRNDTRKLEEFIKKYVSKGNGEAILYKIEHGKIKPSKKFIDYVAELYKGNQVFTLLDEQQVAYAKIIKAATTAKHRTTIIVNGEPGTGKSIVAMNAFATLFQKGMNIRFIAPNAAFKDAMMTMLSRNKADSKSRLKEVFKGSAGFVDAATCEFDALIVDEAHRLKTQGTFMYRGESQIADIIHASRINIFFIDDNQRIRPNDEGSVQKIKDTAAQFHSDIIEVKLIAQFRCSGSAGYVNWLDHTLQIRDTANYNGWENDEFDFRIVDDPNVLAKLIEDKGKEGATARLLAGYAWPWTSAKEGNTDAQIYDVALPEYHFARPWNSRKKSTEWPTNESMKEQIGCVHTAQGLEFDYIGVIIGNDMKYNPETKAIEAHYEEYYDSTGKKGLRDHPEELTKLIKNIYKVLMSRGIKGCYVFCCDEELREYMKSRLNME